MFAVIESGGKQYKVSEGEKIKLELLPTEQGQSVELDKVLMIANGEDVKIGKPYVEGAKVTADVIGHGRGEKIQIIKMRRRKNSRVTQGHRQYYTELKITGIS